MSHNEIYVKRKIFIFMRTGWYKCFYYWMCNTIRKVFIWEKIRFLLGIKIMLLGQWLCFWISQWKKIHIFKFDWFWFQWFWLGKRRTRRDKTPLLILIQENRLSFEGFWIFEDNSRSFHYHFQATCITYIITYTINYHNEGILQVGS